jgi:beta-galactosidase GanA
MGTPTYSIPAWMAKQNPEILATKLNGTKNTYGMRQNNLRTRTGINSFKRAVHYYFNYSGSEISFNYPHKPGSDLLANRVAAGEKITLAPWEVAIIEEGAK